MATKRAKMVVRDPSLDEMIASGWRWQPTEEAPAPAPEPPAGVLRRVGDMGLAAARGVVSVPEGAVGLADLVTGGWVGKALENEGGAFGFRPKQAKEYLGSLQSPEQQAANRAVQEADGLVETTIAALRNPSTILSAAAESVPLMGAGGVIGRALMKVAPAIGFVGAGAAGEGIVTAGSQAESIRQETPDGLLTGTQAALAAGSGAMTGLLGLLGGTVARRLGISDIDTMLAGKGTPEITKGFVRRVLEGAVSEGILEELPQSIQEQVAQNMALGKPLGEGVPQAAVLGALAGGLMGGGGNAISAGSAIRQEKSGTGGPTARAADAGLEAAAQQADTIAVAGAAPAAVAPAGPAAAPVAAVEQPQSGVSRGTEPPVEPMPEVPMPAPVAPAGPAGAAFEQREADRPPEPTAPPMPGEKTFTTMDAAMRAKERAGPGHEIAPVAGGVVVRKVDAETGEIAAPELPGTIPPSGPVSLGGTIPVTSELPGVEAAPPPAPDPAPLPDDILNPKGAPFTHRGAAAIRMRELGKDTHTIAKVANGFVVRNLAAVAAPLDAAAHAAATSPNNDLLEPTPAQKEAGNYTLGHHRLAGLDLSIENPAGSVRRGTDRDGKAWENTLQHHYGYIKGSIGADKDHVDAFVKPGTADDWAGTVFVVDQVHPDTGKFDEHKALLGFADIEEAKAAYAANYAKGWKGLKAISAMPAAEFNTWVRSDAPKAWPLVPIEGASDVPQTGDVPGAAAGAVAPVGGDRAGGEVPVVADDATWQKPVAESLGLEDQGGAWSIDTGGLGVVGVKFTSREPLRAEIKATMGNHRAPVITAEGEPAIRAAIERSRDGLNEARTRMAAEVASTRVEGPTPALPAPDARWAATLPKDREPLLLKAGWNAGSPGTQAMMAKAWADLTPSQKARLTKAMEPAADAAPTSADEMIYSMAGRDWRIRLTRHADGEVTWGAEVKLANGYERVPGNKVPLPVAKKASAFQKQTAVSPESGQQVPAPAPKPDKAEIRPFRQPDGSVGYEAVPIKPPAPAPAPAATATPAPATKRPKAAQAAADARRAQLERYFTPGNIVKSYGGFDEVLALKHTDDGGFSVHVHSVTKSQGSGQWVRIGKPQDARWHSTFPEARELKAGPVAGPLMHMAGDLVSYTEGRADGQPFKNAPDRGVAPVAAPAPAPAAEPEQAPPAPEPASAASAETMDLRKIAHADERPGDVMLGNDKFVTEAQAKAAALQHMTEREHGMPFQFNRVLDIAPRDWTRMVQLMTGREYDDPTRKPKTSANTVFTEDAAAAARAVLKRKLGIITSGIDPEILQAGITLAGYHIEKGARTFAAYASAMLADLGDAVKPYLKSWYMGVKYDPRAAAWDGMSSAADVEAATVDAPADSAEIGPKIETAAASADTVQESTHDDPAPATPAPAVNPSVDEGQRPVGSEQPARGAQQPRDGDRLGDDGSVQQPGGRADGLDDEGGDVGDSGGDAAIPDGADDGVAGGVRGVSARDFRPAVGGLTREGSWLETARRNLDLIDLARKIESEKRPATPEEQAQLSKYVGFGAGEIRNNIFPVPQAYHKVGKPAGTLIFPEAVHSAPWKALAERAAALPVEWQRTILQSTQYAHYTSEGIIRSVWSAVQRLGFTGGKVFEPGGGIGSFAMLMPDTVRKTSKYTAIEFDGPTALIARLLSPEQHMLHDDFIKRKLPDDFYDLAVGNPPFAPTPVLADPRYEKNGFFLHDFFFAKTIDKVRPGGVLAFVTSKGTMDKQTDKARKYLSERADFLGAIRLPSTAFEANAGTSVVTDVIFLRKRFPGEAPAGQPWAAIKSVETKDGPTPINEWFADHPDMVLGQNRISGNTDDMGRRINSNGRGGEKYTVVSYDETPAELEAKFAAAIEHLPQNVYSPLRQDAAAVVRETAKMDFDPKIKREGVVYLGPKGDLLRVEDGVGKALGEVVKLSAKEEAWFKSYVGLRDLIQHARHAQVTDGEWQPALKKLNTAYDKFVKAHGYINAFRLHVRKSTDEEGKPVETTSRVFTNKRLYSEDYDAAIVRQLEVIDEDGNIKKGAFLKDRTIGKPVQRRVETVGDALAVSLDGIGRLDLGDIAARMNMTRDEAIEALGDQVYRTPAGQWQLTDEYLSGNVVEKLAEAIEAARLDRTLERNIKALEKVQPEKLGPSQISVKLGAPWVDAKHVNDFAKMIEAGTVTFDSKTETWQVAGGNERSRRAAGAEFGTAARAPSELLEAILNSRSIKVTATVDKKTVTDEAATTAANDMAKKIKDRFKSWVWTDSERAADLVEGYNARYNNLAPRAFDGSHLTLPGVSLRYKLHPHQLRAIWRQIQTGDVYLAHAVGAGKTIEMIAGGMEQKRLGLIKKPVYVVPNHMLEQFSNEFMELYPLANIMVADDQNFSKERRKAFIAAATLNAPDAIVITHSAFERIGVKEESVLPIRDEILADLEEELEAAAKDAGARVRRSQLQQQVEAVNQRFDSILSTGRKDALISFEDMGADYIYVDEAHTYRKLDFHTAQSIKGIDPNGSRRALDMYVKTRFLQKQRPGRAMTFASGTAVTNTMGELFTIMRFFDPRMLDEGGISTFDSWARMFGQVGSALEPNAAGKYEVVERFSKFDNVPELMARVRKFMDVLQSDQLGAIVKRPDVEGGKPDLIVVPPTQSMKDYQKNVLEPRLIVSRAWKPSKEEPHNPDPVLAIITDGRFAATDPRFFGGKIAAGETTKMDRAAEEIAAEYAATAGNVYNDRDGKPMAAKGSTQIVFYNVGFGDSAAASRAFNSRAAFTKAMTDKGVKRDHIAWFDDADTDAKKEAIFKGMRNGTYRVLVGSAKKMGTGVNVQNRLSALHYMDPPWYPADVEQPHGRIIRQGNQNTEVRIKWYATKGGYDSTMWQMVGRKQRFIDQAFRGDKNLRSMEDLGEASLFEQAAALSSGDPRAMQLAGLKQDVERMERQQAAHANEQIAARNSLRSVEWNVENDTNRVQTYERAENAMGGRYFDFRTGTVAGRDYTKQTEFGQALKDAFNRGAADAVLDPNTKDRPLATLGSGIKVAMHANEKWVAESEEKNAKMVAVPNGEHELTVTVGGYTMSIVGSAPGFDASVDALGLARKIINALNGIDSDLQSAKRRLDEYEIDRTRLRKKIGAPFEHEREMLEKYGELKALEEELRLEGLATPAAGQPAGTDETDETTGNIAQTGDPAGNTTDVVFKRGEGGGLDLASAQSLADKLASSGMVRLNVVRSIDDMPPQPKRWVAAMAPDGRVRGAYIRGTDQVWMFSDHIRGADEFVQVALHEAFHRGLAKTIPQAKPLLREMHRTNEALRKATAEQVARHKIGQDEAIEEALADMAGEGTARDLKGWDRLLQLVRDWLGKVAQALGMPTMTWTDDMVADFVAGIRREGLKGGVHVDRGAAAAPAASLSRSFGDVMNDARDIRLPAQYRVGDLFDSDGRISWWHKTVGTMHNLAERSPLFKRVYDAVQNFVGDVSFYASEAADLAPRILPKLEHWKDVFKSPLKPEDAKAIAAPIFEGTLTWARGADGKPVKVADMEAAAAGMSVHQKAQELLRRDMIDPKVLRMWQGMPIEQYEAAVESRYESQAMKAGIVWKDAELKAMFGLTEGDKGTIGLYREFRKAIDKSITNLAVSDMLRYGGDDTLALRRRALALGDVDKVATMLRDHLFELAEQQPDRASVLNDTGNRMIDKADRAKDLMARGYAPLSRFGQYSLDVVDADGERVYFGLFENASERSRMARQMRANFPTATISTGTVSQEAYRLFAGVSPETLELFGEMLGLESSGDDAASKAFQTYLKITKSTRSAMKRLIQRKGIAGFSEDAGRVLAGFVYSNARQTASNLHMGEITHATSEIPKGDGQLQDAAVRLAEYVKNPQEEAQAVRGWLFAQYLGGSVASALVNLTQPATVTFPYLSQFGGAGKAAARMANAARLAGKKDTGDAALDKAMKRAEELGVVAPQEVHQLQAQAMGRATLRSGDGTKVGNAYAGGMNKLSQLGFAWGKVFGMAEQVNRRITFIAAYKTAVAEGMADPEAFATKAVAETQFTYNKGNKPRWARGAVGSVAFTFKQYSISYVELLGRMWNTGEAGSPERAAGRKAVLLALAVMMLAGGADGLPFMQDVEDVIDGLLQRLGFNFSTKQAKKEFLVRALGDGGAQFVSKGLSGLPGAPIDVSGRMGMGNLIPGTGFLTKKTDHTRDAAELAGPLGDLASRGFKAGGQMVDGDPVKALQTIAPTAARNAMKAVDMASTGMYRDDRGRKVLDVDGYDVVAKFFSFQPNDVARVQDATGMVQNMIAQNKMRESEIADEWAVGVFEGDKGKQADARAALARWNENNPAAKIRIDMPQVLKRVRAMRASKAERIAKTAPREIRAAVRAELAGVED